MRDFGKAGFLKIQDRGQHLQVYARRDVLGEEAFAALSRARRRRHRRRRGPPVPDADARADARRRRAPTAGEVAASAAREVARPAGRRGALPTALRRPDRQSGRRGASFETRTAVIRYLRDFLAARGFLEVETPMMQPISGGARRAPVRHASQHARPRSLPAHLARALPEAAGGRRPRARLRAQPQLPQRGASTARTTPSSRCSSSTRRTRRTTDLMDLTEEMLVGVSRETVADGCSIAGATWTST